MIVKLKFKLYKLLVTKSIRSYQIVGFQIIYMSGYQIVKLPNCQLPNSRVTKLLSYQTVSYQIISYQNISYQIISYQKYQLSNYQLPKISSILCVFYFLFLHFLFILGNISTNMRKYRFLVRFHPLVPFLVKNFYIPRYVLNQEDRKGAGGPGGVRQGVQDKSYVVMF